MSSHDPVGMAKIELDDWPDMLRFAFGQKKTKLQTRKLLLQTGCSGTGSVALALKAFLATSTSLLPQLLEQTHHNPSVALVRFSIVGLEFCE